jgi:phosphodiester glycosidase
VAAIKTSSLPDLSPRAASAPATFRAELEDGCATTVHLAAYDLAHNQLRVVSLPSGTALAAWCRSVSISEALVGGFFVRVTGQPLGELQMGGLARDSVPFMPPWDALRACLHIEGGAVRLARRPDLPPRPHGDVLQAGPLLVEGGSPLVVDGIDTEGFSAGESQFDSDLTVGRYPRAALGLAGGIALAVTCDGRAADDAGLTLGELAELMAALGAHTALNLDGGGSTTMVCGAKLVNQPREQDGSPIPNGRPISTAITFTPH